MGKYLTRMETQFIQNSIDLSSINAVMDVGPEAGRFSQFPTENTLVISIDIDSYGLKRLKLKGKNVNVVQADARKIPLKNETLDAILMIEVLDHITRITRNFSRMLPNTETRQITNRVFREQIQLQSQAPRNARKILHALLQKRNAHPAENRVQS